MKIRIKKESFLARIGGMKIEWYKGFGWRACLNLGSPFWMKLFGFNARYWG